MKKKTPATFGDRLINFHLPDAWHKLEQWQLRYVCYIMTRFDPVTAKTYIFVRLLGITVLRRQEDGWVCSVRNGWKRFGSLFIRGKYSLSCTCWILSSVRVICLSVCGGSAGSGRWMPGCMMFRLRSMSVLRIIIRVFTHAR